MDTDLRSRKTQGSTRRPGWAVVVAMWVAVTSPADAQPRAKPSGETGGVLQVEAPLALTTSEGAGLELVSLKARAVVQEPLAFTEMHLVFRNPENRVREGRFRITLPSGAVISRFAMKINGAWQEGEVVEKQAARRAYEDFLHRRQDPALLESEAGNEFSARIFPIPAQSEKELIVSYSQELPQGTTGYRLPLRGLPRLGELDVRVFVAKTTSPSSGKAASSLGGAVVRQEVVEVNKHNYRPDQDLVIDATAASAPAVLRHQNLVVARIKPMGDSHSMDPLTNLTVLFDTSASRALGFSQSVGRLQEALAHLSRQGDFWLEVFAFDQEVSPVFRGQASAFSEAAARKLIERRAEGASNLQLALKHLQGKAIAGRRLLLVSDGVATAGDLQGDVLRALTKSLTASGYVRADVLAVGGIRDDERLNSIVTAGLPKAGVVLQANASFAEVQRRLRSSTRVGLKLEVPGAAWVWPVQLDGVQPGDEVLVYADLPAETPLQVRVAGETRLGPTSATNNVERPLIERAWIKARLSRLQHQRDTVAAGDPDLRAALAQQMIQLSVQNRVLCDLTALLVLETEHDYVRFNIDRRALTDIVTVGSGGLEVMSRRGQGLASGNGLAVAPAVAQPSMAKGRAARPRPTQALPGAREARDMSVQAPVMEEAAAADASDDSRAPRTQGTIGSIAGSAASGSPASGGAPSAAASAPPSPAPAESMRKRADISAGRGLAGVGAAAPRTVQAPEAEGLAAPPPAARRSIASRRPAPSPEKQSSAPALQGKMAEVTALLRQGRQAQALQLALAWRTQEPGDFLAIVALGQALEAAGRHAEAARVYGSIIDLFPGRADLRRFAAGHLERLATPHALALAVDCLRKAAADRADHPSSHHLLAMALLQDRQASAAFEALEAAFKQNFPPGRFAGSDQVLREDLGLAAAAWMLREPKRKVEIQQRLERAGGTRENAASIRFILTWETDANDVDFHIRDGRGGHAFYSQPTLPSGGHLYADVTTGYGPECFTVRQPQGSRAYPYTFQAHYYSKGPMGYGLGRLQIIDHDGRGQIRIEARPFVVMSDGAYLDLGKLSPAAAKAVAAEGKVLSVP